MGTRAAGGWHWDASVKFDPQVHDYLSASLGRAKLRAVSCALCRPSLKPTVRVNTLAASVQDVSDALVRKLSLREPPRPHAALPATLVLRGRGALGDPDYAACSGHEVVVNRYAAEAVLKGANVFAPGVLAVSRGVGLGDLVGVSVALEKPGSSKSPIPRGYTLGKLGGEALQLPDRSHLFLGTARCAMGRRAMFGATSGVALEMQERLFHAPPLNGVLPGLIMPQALPSIAAAQALSPPPGCRVLDMCAAPGGKTTLLAQLMRGEGEVVALDRTHAKVATIRATAADFGMSHCITAIKADATQAVRRRAQPSQRIEPDSSADSFGSAKPAGSAADEHSDFEGFEPETFDHVLLDPPCSALGLRPRLLNAWSLPQLLRIADYQRALLQAAIALLKPGGTLVYSTCTISPAENECNVRWALDRWSGPAGVGGCQLQLLPAEPLVGASGLMAPAEELPLSTWGGSGSGPWLSAEEAAMVQRFDPSDGDGDDTIGFFVARFRKGCSLPRV